MNSKYVKNVAWLIGGSVLRMIMQFVISLATARYLGATNYGTINYVAAYASFVLSLVSLGLQVTVVKEIVQDKYDNETVVGTAIAMRMVVAILSNLLFYILMYFVGGKSQEILIIAILLSLESVFSVFDTLNCYFQALYESKYTSISGVVAYIAVSAYRVVLLVREAHIYYFAFASPLVMLVSVMVLIYVYVFKQKMGFKFSWKCGKYLLGQSYAYLVAGLMAVLYSRMDKVMVGSMIDSTAVGYYSVAVTIASLWSIVPSAVTRAISPLLIEAYDKDKKEYIKKTITIYSLMQWLNIIYSLVITLLCDWIILVLYGNEFLQAREALVIVVWYTGISYLATIRSICFSCEKKQKYELYLGVAGCLINLFLNYLLIPIWGIKGAAATTLATQILRIYIIPLFFAGARSNAILTIKAIHPKYIFNKENKTLLRREIRKIRETIKAKKEK